MALWGAGGGIHCCGARSHRHILTHTLIKGLKLRFGRNPLFGKSAFPWRLQYFSFTHSKLFLTSWYCCVLSFSSSFHCKEFLTQFFVLFSSTNTVLSINEYTPFLGVDRLSAPILSILPIIDIGHFQNRFADNFFFFFFYANKHTIYRWHYLLVNK